MTALALARGKISSPDICCLQEIENMQALRNFSGACLDKKYPNALLKDSHDPRLIDVGVLSVYPICKVVSHIDEKDHRGYYLFSRDCLEVTFNVGGKNLTLFVTHLKSKYGKSHWLARPPPAVRRLHCLPFHWRRDKCVWKP